MSILTESVHATTDDGVRLHLTRVHANNGASRGAVVLQHGLGSNGVGFLLPQHSLSARLAALGYDCFVPQLRGAGLSGRRSLAFGLFEYLTHDLPAVLATACATSGHARVHFIGHSMGGVLMLLYGIDHPDAPVARVVTVGSALDYRPGRNIYRALRLFRPLIGPLPALPFGPLSSAIAPLGGIGPALLPEGMNFQRSNTSKEVIQQVLARGFTTIPLRLLDDLDTAFGAHGLHVRGRDAYLPRAGAFHLPTLMLGGSRDLQCPPEATAASFALLTGVRDKQRLTFGKAYGQADDYGHFDLLVGKRSASEVWPHIEAFLAGEPVERTAPRAAAAAGAGGAA